MPLETILDLSKYLEKPIRGKFSGGREGMFYNLLSYDVASEGAQWLSGRVLDSRPRGRGFEPHRRHCVVVLEQDTFILA